jgi:hypothetical protein
LHFGDERVRGLHGVLQGGFLRDAGGGGKFLAVVA